MKVKSIAIYLDTENIKGNLSLQDLLDDINLKVSREEENMKCIFSFKKAIGDKSSLLRFREQLKELNFEIQDAPHIANKKNRADLIICLDAFEKLYINNPPVDLFVFLTNDSDYSVVMEILRRYNKEVWLVTTEEDAQKTVFKSSADNILLINDYQQAEKVEERVSNKNKVDNKVIEIFLEGLQKGTTYEKNKYNKKFIKSLTNIGLSLNDTTFKKSKNFYKHLEKINTISLKKKGQFILIDDGSDIKSVKEEKIQLPTINLTTKQDKRAFKAILKVLKSYDLDKKYLKGHTNNSFRLIEKTLDMSETSFKNFNGLYKFLEDNKIITLSKNSKKNDVISLENKKIINGLLEKA